MSSTSQYTTFADLYDGLQQRVRAQTGVTATENIAKQFINSAHADIYIGHGEKFAWAERRGTITTHAVYETGTVTATKGSQTLTGSGTAWNTNNDFSVKNMRVGGKVTISGSVEVYSITAVGGDTSATISPAWIGETDSELSYQYFEDEYALASDFAKPIDYRSFDYAARIRLVGRNDFRHWFPRNRVPSRDLRCATILDLPFDGSTTPVRKVAFGPPPIDTQVIPYAYVTSSIAVSSAGTAQSGMSDDADEPIMPLRHRHLILLKALSQWYRDRKDDSRGREVEAEYQQLLSRVIGDQDVGQQKARMRPLVNPYRSRAARPFRGGVGKYDINGRFDRFES